MLAVTSQYIVNISIRKNPVIITWKSVWTRRDITKIRHHSYRIRTYPEPVIGKTSSVQRVSLSSLFSRSFRATSASASTIPPAIAPTSEPWTPWSCKTQNHNQWNLPSANNKVYHTMIPVYNLQSLTAPATRVRTSSQVVVTSCPLASFTMGWVRRCLFSPSYENLREGGPERGQ